MKKMNQNPETLHKTVSVLLTGGAGFIGSHILEALLVDARVGMVRVLDNLSTGHKENISHLFSNPCLEFMEGDIRDVQTCREACEGIDLVCHQAALGSVPRSLRDPLTSHEVNVTGTLHVLQASVEKKVKRVVFAASSSTYGDSPVLPKVEDTIGKPLSPYAVTKFVNELYAEVYARVYGLEYIGLRYFNVFGPRQDPSGPYAAVIPLFLQAAMENKRPAINGDGAISRDFTYVANAVEANIKALFALVGDDANDSPVNQIYNVACGSETSLNTLWQTIKQISSCALEPMHGPARQGDVQHSLADISKIKEKLGYTGEIQLAEGLHKTWAYLRQIQV